MPSSPVPPRPRFALPSLPALLLAVLAAIAAAPALAGDPKILRVATYNIEWLGTRPSAPERAERLREVIRELDASIVALQEIKDRESLRPFLPSPEWTIVIDDDSRENQDLALAVRAPYRVEGPSGEGPDYDAEDTDFLYPGGGDKIRRAFPDRRDALAVRVAGPGLAKPVLVVVHHAKARVGGRAATDPARESAAALIVEALRERGEAGRAIVLGDFNDNPDDRSINILETGNPKAKPGPDGAEDDRFLVNLAQRALEAEEVTWGLRESHILGGKLRTTHPGGRARNNEGRGGEGKKMPILFDQILASPDFIREHRVVEAKVFDHPSAQRGHKRSDSGPIAYPSDHTPFFADFELQ